MVPGLIKKTGAWPLSHQRSMFFFFFFFFFDSSIHNTKKKQHITKPSVFQNMNVHLVPFESIEISCWVVKSLPGTGCPKQATSAGTTPTCQRRGMWAQLSWQPSVGNFTKRGRDAKRCQAGILWNLKPASLVPQVVSVRSNWMISPVFSSVP